MTAKPVKTERDQTTFLLPVTLKRKIAREAFDNERTMTDIITEQLAKRYPELELSPAQ